MTHNRLRQPIKLNQLVTPLTSKSEIVNRKMAKPIIKAPNFSKAQLWELFKYNFKRTTGKELVENEDTIRNISLLFYYFLRDDKFYRHSNNHKELSHPNFDKGLLIIGGYGTGKTSYMSALEQCFIQLNYCRYKIYSTNEVVQKFENCETPCDKKAFFSQMNLGTNLYDDLTTERIASNFGKVDIMKEVFEERNLKNKLTHATANFKEGQEGDVETALLNFGERYGSRFYDRIFEAFNIVEFKGKSMRR